MKLTKENVYINLRGKSKEELTELYWLLANNNEVLYRSFQRFLEYPSDGGEPYIGFCESSNYWWSGIDFGSKKEITIQQLKQILQPMKEFTPIAMRCTQEQFDAVRPKLEHLNIMNIDSFVNCGYLINNLSDTPFFISNVSGFGTKAHNRKIYETWNEEIFLKACGIEAETLQEKALRLENELKEVKQQIEEENNIKIGDWVKRTYRGIEIFKADHTHDYRYINSEQHIYQKITNPELIKLLEQEIK